MNAPPLKTPQQVRAELAARGESISDWAFKHRLSPYVVYQVLSGVNKARLGQGHRAAVLLGLKAGTIVPREGR